MNRGLRFALLILFCAATFGFSQEVSEKKDVSVFNLSYYSYRIPDRVLANIDSAIRGVFVNMGRFKVLQVAKSFDNPADLQEFIDEIRQMKEENTEIPDEVAYGRMTFSEADYNQLVSSFIVIIPELLTYTSEENDKGVFEVNLKTSYSVLDASTMEIIAQPEIDSNGSDTKSSAKALDSAISSMTAMLTFEVKKISIFTLKTGVLEVNGSKMTLEKGRDMGILPGFEFEIISTQVLSSGKKKDISDGLIIVSDVFEEVSDAVVIYGEPKEGDQLKEVPRSGVDIELYYHGLYNPTNGALTHLGGIKATVAIGFFAFRPIVGVELPVYDYGVGALIFLIGIPCNFYLGGEYNFYLGRLSIAPTFTIGAGGLYLTGANIPDDKKFALTHLGGSAYLNISYLITRDIKLTFDLGGSYWFSVYESLFETINSYYGAMVGIGVTFKA